MGRPWRARPAQASSSRGAPTSPCSPPQSCRSRQRSSIPSSTGRAPVAAPPRERPSGPMTVFDRYEVLERLAVGGMGEVFLARQIGVPGFERLIILKALLPNLAGEEGFVEQF